MSVVAAYEGDTDLPVVQKLLADAGLELAASIDCGGKDQLDSQLAAYDAAAQGSPWFVLRDLDTDAPCAPALLEDMQVVPATWMCFRVAVRELEAWLLADHEAVSAYFRVDARRIPDDPDGVPDPTAVLVALARKSKRVAIRRAMVPAPGTSVAVGPLYEAMLVEFGRRHWDLGRACARSASLRSARCALNGLARRWRAAAEGARRG
jgi:hypothetical protein